MVPRAVRASWSMGYVASRVAGELSHCHYRNDEPGETSDCRSRPGVRGCLPRRLHAGHGPFAGLRWRLGERLRSAPALLRSALRLSRSLWLSASIRPTRDGAAPVLGCAAIASLLAKSRRDLRSTKSRVLQMAPRSGGVAAGPIRYQGQFRQEGCPAAQPIARLSLDVRKAEPVRKDKLSVQ
jgi:hypothetical protein